jgi:alkylation response protein AidB-like acyl-CoA dehydrogenase
MDSGEDAQLLAAQAKVFTVQTCRHHLPKLLHAMGAEGLAPAHPVARHVAGAQMAGLTDGSDEMLLERIAHLSRSRDA